MGGQGGAGGQGRDKGPPLPPAYPPTPLLLVLLRLRLHPRPQGKIKTMRCKSVILAVLPSVANLGFLDLDEDEKAVFSGVRRGGWGEGKGRSGGEGRRGDWSIGGMLGVMLGHVGGGQGGGQGVGYREAEGRRTFWSFKPWTCGRRDGPLGIPSS